MKLTGNPFVDTGLMVLATLASKNSVEELEFVDIRRVFGDGSGLSRHNLKLKSYTMVFGTNGPLTQPAYKKASKNEPLYRAVLARLLKHAEIEGVLGDPCDLTGIKSDLNFHEIVCAALRDNHLPTPEQKWVGRDWVPLGGSLGNDAQALPGASRPLHVSALALFALQYLPLGVFLFKGKLTCFQSTVESLAQSLVRGVVEENKVRSIGSEILGKGRGTGIIIDFLLPIFYELKEHDSANLLPNQSELLLWLFSNSGTGADCVTEQVPEFALRFIAEASVSHAPEIRSLLLNDPKDPRFQLFECIRLQRDYLGLYPYKRWKGASPAFYEFYQRHIRGFAGNALQTARRIAFLTILHANEKERKEIRKSEYLRAPQGRNRIRKVIAEHLSLAEYESLFSSSRHPIRVQSDGWNLIRFYLSQEFSDNEYEAQAMDMKTTHPKIIQIGDAYFAMKGPTKIKNILDRLARRALGVRWLQDVFCALAEDPKYDDFNLGTWGEFVCDEDGRPITFELLFQMRLYLANKYRESINQQKETAA